MVKIIFFDIDGTLIDIDADDMSDKTKYALQKLKENKILIFAATGRPYYIVPKFDGIEFDGFLTFNGQLCLYNDEIIYENHLDPQDVKKVIQNASEIDKACMAASDTLMGANFYDKKLDDYMLIADPNAAKVLQNFDELIKENIYQMMVAATKDQEPIILKDLNHTTCTRWHPDAMDIIPATGGKGIGTKKILEYFGFSADEAMAFGDGGNDKDMLETVGCGIAMGNARDSVKVCAEATTLSNEQDGVAIAIEKAILSAIRPTEIPLDQLNARGKHALMGNLGIQYTYASEERVEATMPVDERTRQPFGILHGGATLALAETVAGLGSMLIVQPDEIVVGMQVSGNHISSAHEGDTVRAVATIFHKGRSSHVWNVDVFTSTDRLVSSIRVVNSVMKKR